jgi:hypothetical protein
MQHQLANTAFRTTTAENPNLSVAIIYEDFEAGKHARKTYDYLVQVLGHDMHLTSSMWKFDVLAIPKLREIAAKDAAMGDIVIIASHGGDTLPKHVQLWADQWLACRGHSSALVALFDCSKERAMPIRTFLETLAQRGQLEFFVQPEEGPARRLTHVAVDKVLARPNQGMLETLSDAVKEPMTIPRWGINE